MTSNVYVLDSSAYFGIHWSFQLLTKLENRHFAHSADSLKLFPGFLPDIWSTQFLQAHF